MSKVGSGFSASKRPEEVEEVEEILREGQRLLLYISTNIWNIFRGSKSWSKFRSACAEAGLCVVEGLFHAIGTAPYTYREYQGKRMDEDVTNVLNRYLKNCIEMWIYYIKLKREFPRWKPKKRVMVYWIRDGKSTRAKIHPLYFERIYPKCSRCGEEMVMDCYGFLHCPKCDGGCE